VRKRANLSLRK